MEEILKELLPYGMTSATVITALIKNPDFLKLIYKDLAHPSVKKVGKALSSVFGLSATLLLPVKLLNDKTNLIFTKHMENFRNKIDSIPDDKIAEVPPEIGIPILDKLTFTSDEKLSELFINLLANAANKDAAICVHPYFISSIGNLCPDEAVLIKNIFDNYIQKNVTYIPYLSIVEASQVVKFQSSIVMKLDYIIRKELLDNIQFPEKYRLYVDNLISLGFLEKHQLTPLTEKEKYYKPIYDQYADDFNEYKKQISIPAGSRIEARENFIQITATGNHFIKAINHNKIE